MLKSRTAQNEVAPRGSLVVKFLPKVLLLIPCRRHSSTYRKRFAILLGYQNPLNS